MSVTSAEDQAHGQSRAPSVSGDGRFVAFESAAKNLVLGDTNGASDIFVRDLVDGTTEIVSVDSLGAQGNRASSLPSISADGRYVAFSSLANNLAVADLNDAADVFVHDRQSGITWRVSVDSQGYEGNADSSSAHVSVDGRFVAFHSLATNLIVGDTNGVQDVFVHDRQTGATTRASVAAGGAQVSSSSAFPSISGDGRYVAFQSLATTLVAGDTNGVQDVFVHDRQTVTTTRVSIATGGAQANSTSRHASISADGLFVAFDSLATNLVAGDTNGFDDVFVRDVVGSTTERASVATGGAQGNQSSTYASITADGRFVAFHALASNLVTGDSNGFQDAFLRDRHTGTTERLSVSADGTQGNGDSGLLAFAPSISTDGRNIVFESAASNLVSGDTNGGNDVFLRAPGAGGTENVSNGVGGAPSNAESAGPRISPDCRYVLFESDASNLVAGDTNGFRDVFVRDNETSTITLVSVGPGGVQGNGDSFHPSITTDGRYVAFDSVASNLVAGDTNGVSDVFRRDLLTNTTTRASVTTGGVQGNGGSANPSIALDGSAVAFESASTNLVAGDTNGVMDVFVRNLLGNSTSRASVHSSGAEGNGNSNNASISADGLLVAFDSTADNLVAGDTNLVADVFVRNPSAATTVRVSVDSGGTQGLGASTDPSISADGRFVAFESAADNLVSGDTNLTLDVFVRDRTLATTVRSSVDSEGTQGLGASEDPSISADGRYTAFSSAADNLVAGDTNLTLDVFVRDRLVASTVRVSVASDGTQGLGPSEDASISGDGICITFESDASNLDSDDTNGFQDVFLHDEGTAAAFDAFCFGDVLAAACPCGNDGDLGHGCENSSLTGGAILIATGAAKLSADTVRFTSSGEKPTALSIFLQGSTAIAPTAYGDGVRCTGGTLKRLYAKSAVAGVVFAPQPGDLSVSARSAFLNATIPLGATREYQVYYRDNAAFCDAPQGSNFNVSNGILVAWGG